jgi:hypothetical protein
MAQSARMSTSTWKRIQKKDKLYDINSASIPIGKKSQDYNKFSFILSKLIFNQISTTLFAKLFFIDLHIQNLNTTIYHC